MDSSSSLSTHIRRYHVFPSFHGPDVRKGFLSHLHYHFASKGITTFKDQEIERGHTIGPELVQAIRDSRVSIVVLSKKYASSSWCLDELVEILKCEEDEGQIVMTIFYEVDPSDVRKQRGDFGSTFEETCQEKSEEVKLRWSKALAHVATIAGEHSLNWASEAEMIRKIATDVSKKLNVTPSRDFEGMVGLEAHLTKLDSLLCLECDDVKMIGIWGPAGIGIPSFHGPDVGREFLNHVQNQFARKGMRTFNDQGIERSHTIGPEVVQGIRESKVSIVVFSPNYASSRWCLDELVEIIKCKETSGEMIVMPTFNRVSPSNVRLSEKLLTKPVKAKPRK